MPYKNKEDALAYGKWYRKTYKEKDKASKTRWRENNREIANLMVANWAARNKERIKENNAARYKRDRDRITKRNSQYRKNNPEASIACVHKRRAKKAESGGSYTAKEWKELCKKYDFRCVCCGKKTKLTSDHIIPITKGGTSNIENIQPLCMSCNAKKYTKIIDFRIKFDLNTTKAGKSAKTKN